MFCAEAEFVDVTESESDLEIGGNVLSCRFQPSSDQPELVLASWRPKPDGDISTISTFHSASSIHLLQVSERDVGEGLEFDNVCHVDDHKIAIILHNCVAVGSLAERVGHP
ncbi:uncharacterized protein [Physcomitrium patens]|uniref:uncharacterized protein isoform X2 n=1 Tax=Physcomitrium patens TaxID=3218 RepID=UPI003CCCBED1